MAGLISYGAYIPACRLNRADVGAVVGGGGRGTRAVANFDEDTTTMGVAAAADALRAMPADMPLARLLFATTSPAYADKANATAVHAALSLPSSVLAFDLVGSVRTGIGALELAAKGSEPSLVVIADQRGGLPGGSDEIDGGDAAVAFLFGEASQGPAIAELAASASVTEEFLERWRLPQDNAARIWEERFASEIYPAMAKEALAKALAAAGKSVSDIDHLIVSGMNARAVKDVAKRSGVGAEAIVDSRENAIGNAGAAQAGLMLADVLDSTGSDKLIVILVLSDGVTATVLKTTAALAEARSPHPLADQIPGSITVQYADFLGWRGRLEREPQRRPKPVPPYAPPAYRRRRWKFGLVGGRCSNCGWRHVNAGRVCLSCRSVDTMTPEPMAQVSGTVAFSTVDRLAFSPQPPLTMVHVNFDGGGRLRCQLADAPDAWDPVGKRVEMSFRRMTTAEGIHNYFWKARPARPVRDGGQ